jgi:hypothetical protein
MVSTSLHEKLMQRHEETTGYYDRSFFKNGEGANAVYSIGYTFTANGKMYHNYSYSKKIPTYQEGVVYYNPDNLKRMNCSRFDARNIRLARCRQLILIARRAFKKAESNRGIFTGMKTMKGINRQ